MDVEIDVTWHDTLAVVDCGQNPTEIGCSHCGASIDTEWWGDLLEAHCDDGFATLAVTVPCCSAATSLDVLDYDWPCGFARFEIAVRNPDRGWFSEDERATLQEAIGLLKEAGLHGRKYTIDAVLAAVALRQPGPVTVFTSHEDDLRKLCGDRAVVRTL